MSRPLDKGGSRVKVSTGEYEGRKKKEKTGKSALVGCRDRRSGRKSGRKRVRFCELTRIFRFGFSFWTGDSAAEKWANQWGTGATNRRALVL